MTAITITPFLPRDRQALDDLIFRSHHVHTHLDWHDIYEWLDGRQQGSLRLAWQDRRLMGALALSTPLNKAVWFRLMALHDFAPGKEVMDALWAAAADELREKGVETAYVLLSRTWVQQLISPLGFQFDEDIITLQRSGQQLPSPQSDAAPITNLREMLPADLDGVMQVDHAAFAPPWQLARDELFQARRISSASTVAIQNDTIIGYQISTVYRDGAHLARLAVTPNTQGRGIGGALVGDVLRRFFRRGIYIMTVNTQATNHRSQRLYYRFGFERNGNDLPVWSIRL
jgi:[ribosomal protein S18]-alanine N-acetyltransferase